MLKQTVDPLHVRNLLPVEAAFFKPGSPRLPGNSEKSRNPKAWFSPPWPRTITVVSDTNLVPLLAMYGLKHASSRFTDKHLKKAEGHPDFETLSLSLLILEMPGGLPTCQP